MYNLEHFISKFEVIPENMWTTGGPGVKNWVRQSGAPRCALGWCGVDDNYIVTNEAVALSNILKNQLTDEGIMATVYYLNDGANGNRVKYGETPKKRILNVLYAIREEEQLKQSIDLAQNIINTTLIEELELV